MTKSKLIDSFLKENYNLLDITIAEKIVEKFPKQFPRERLDSLRKRVGERRRVLGLKREESLDVKIKKGDVKIEDVIREDKKIINLKRSSSDYRTKYEYTVKELEKANKIIELHTRLGNDSKPYEIKEIKGVKSQGTVLTLLSDIHAEKRITKESVSGLNEYNPDICAKRVDRYFINLIKLIKKERQDIHIENLVMGLLGDNIHAYIHEEFQQTNYMTPIEASLFVYDLLVSGFNYILNNDDKLKTINIICKVGNHSRTTEKCYSDDEALMSYEYAIYKHLEKHFENEKRLNFIIDNSHFSYFNIYDKTIRFSHGHNFKFANGIGGIYIPLMKFLLRANQQIKANISCMGHWHTAIKIPEAIINGSVCGFDAYAMRYGFSPEPPTQQFQIVDSKRGFTVNCPIILS